MARSPSPENVTDLIAKPPAEYVPEPRYVSKYRDKIRKAAKRGKSAHKTFGVPTVVLNPPGEFLKKRTNVIPQRPEIHHEHYHRPGYQHKLPEWQPIKTTDKDARLSRSRVDFTKKNIDEAKNLKPLKPRKYYVDDRHGTVHALKTSGLYPVYRNRKNYGQVPGRDSPTLRGSEAKQKNRGTSPQREHKEKARKYENGHVRRQSNSPRRHEDKHHRHEVKSAKKHEAKQDKYRSKDPAKHDRHAFEINGKNAEENEAEEKFEIKDNNEDKESEEAKVEIKSLRSVEARKSASHNGDDELTTRGSIQQPRCRYVTEDERDELLYGMKKKWDEMMKKFQCLPFLTDTPPKAKRKAAMEKDLLQLEKDIQIIERHPYIYVYSDPED